MTTNKSREEFIKVQKKRIAVTLIFLIFSAVFLFVWKAYDARQQQLSQEKSIQNKQINQIQEQLKDINSNSDLNLANDSIITKQNDIVNAIKKSQSLPAKIDDVTSITDLYFKGNSLYFKVEIDNKKLPDSDQEKMKDISTINQILLRNKPVACNLMKNLGSWEGSWSISYIYLFTDPQEEIGSITFEPNNC